MQGFQFRHGARGQPKETHDAEPLSLREPAPAAVLVLLAHLVVLLRPLAPAIAPPPAPPSTRPRRRGQSEHLDDGLRERVVGQRMRVVELGELERENLFDPSEPGEQVVLGLARGWTGEAG